MTRRLSSGELQQVMELYRHGNPAPFAAVLRLGGVELRARQKFTPQLVEQAARLYAEGSSLAAISKQVGLTPTAVSTALKRAGVKLRDRHGRPV